MTLSVASFLFNPDIEQPETAAIATIGGKMRVYAEHQSDPLPRGLKYTISEDGSAWGVWQDVNWNHEMGITYPGYIKFTARESASFKLYNFKTPDEADSIMGLTVVLGTCEVY